MVEVKKDGFSVKPVLEAGKVAYGNKDWEVVVMRVSDLWRDVLKEGDKTKQNNMANDCVSVVAGYFGVSNISTPEVLVDSVEVDQKNQQLFMVRELVTQGLAHSLEEGITTQKSAIASGSENEVKKVIPNNMEVMARDVRNATVDQEIGARVDELEFTMSTGPGTDSQNADAIKTVVDDIKKWIKDNKVKRDDPRRGGIDRVVSMLAQRENELRGLLEQRPFQNRECGSIESTFDTFVNAEYIQQPIQLQLDTFPPSWFKSASERFRAKPENNRDSDWQQLIRARINLTNASYIKAKVAAIDGESAKKNQYLVLSERELGLIYNEPGVKWANEKILGDFFKRDTSELKAYFLSLKDGTLNSKSRADVYASFRNYQDGLVDTLMDQQNMTEIDAKGAVAMAWNFLYVSNVFESADNGRDIGGNCGNIFGEQIRAMFHPLSKAQRKFGINPDLDENSRSQGTEEAWGGLVGGWFADMVSWSDTRPSFINGLQSGDIRPYPKRIGASMVELLEVETINNSGSVEKMSLAQALLEKRNVVFGKTDANLFGDYCDKWDTFFKFADYCVGKAPLEAGPKFRVWTNTLADLLVKFRGMKVVGGKDLMFGELDDAQTLVWIIANSVGLHRSPRMLITTPKGMGYEAYVDTILQSPRLVMDKNKRTRIKNMLNANLFDVKKRFKIELEANKRNSKMPEN